MRKSILITGGAGLLGLNWALTTRSRYFVALGLHDRRISLAGVNTYFLDLDSISILAKNIEDIGASIVVHTVGLASVEQCEREPDLARYINVVLAANVAQACKQVGVPMIHISTDHLFRGNESFYDEAFALDPINIYAKTKAESEQRVLEIQPTSLIIRTNFFGWGPRYRQSFSDYIISSLRENREIILFNDVSYTPILASVLAETAHDLLDANGFGIFNVVGDERISKLEFGYKIAKQFDLDVNLIKSGLISDFPSLVQRPRDMSLANRKARDLLKRSLGTVDSHIAALRELEWQRLEFEQQSQPQI